MRVLYLNHTSQISGAEHSLLELLGALPAGVVPAVACPEGPLAAAVRRLGVPVLRVSAAEGSLKLHPWRTSRALVELVRVAVAVRRLAEARATDLVHAHTIRAGIAATGAARIGGPPAVVHLHDRLPAGRVSALTLRTVGRGAVALLANSRYTEASVPKAHRPDVVRVVDNPVDLERFDPAAIEPAGGRARLGIAPSTLVLAVIAQITPWKAQDDAIRVAGLLRDRHPDIRLLLVGSAKFASRTTRYDNRAYRERLERLVGSLGLGREVTFLGEREDIPAILGAVDLLLVPSWEEPFGRSVVEAMAMEVPVVATEVGGPREILRDGEDGLLLPPRRPETWARAIEGLVDEPERRRAMGRSARTRARDRYGLERYVGNVVAAYGEALASSRRSPTGP